MSFANRKDLNQLPQSVTVCHYCLQIQFNSSTCSWQTTIFLNKGVGGGGLRYSLIWSKNKNLHQMLKIQQIFPKLYSCLLYVVFHNLKPQKAGLVDVKKDLNSKRSKGIFVRENLKNEHSY